MRVIHHADHGVADHGVIASFCDQWVWKQGLIPPGPAAGLLPPPSLGHAWSMGEVRSMPVRGDVFADARGGDRTMRVSHHVDQGVIVLSLWLGPVCRASFRLVADDVDRLVAALSGVATPDEREMARTGAAFPGVAEGSGGVEEPGGAGLAAGGDVEAAGSPAVGPDDVERTGRVDHRAVVALLRPA
jgi:hypothetical protein